MTDRPNRAAAHALMAPPPVVAEAVPDWDAELEVMPPRPVVKPEQSVPLGKLWASITNIANSLTALAASTRGDRERLASLESRVRDLEAARAADTERRLAALEAKGVHDASTS